MVIFGVKEKEQKKYNAETPRAQSYAESSGSSRHEQALAIRTTKGPAELRPFKRNRLTGGGADGGVDGREPVVAVGLGAFGDGEEFCLQREGDWPGDTLADLDVVDGTDGGDLDSSADKEDFVSDVEHFSGDDLFLYGDIQVFSDLHDGVAGDARKNAGGQWRSVERAIVNEKNVHAGAFTDMAAGIESDAFGVAVEASFHANELRIHVIRRGLGHGGQSIRGNARPGTHADIDTLGESVWTEIGAP